MSTAAKLKWLMFALIVIVLLIVVFQNLSQTSVTVLLWSVELPQAALLTATLIIGFLLGLSATTLRKVFVRRAKKKSGN